MSDHPALKVYKKLETAFGPQNWWPLLENGICIYKKENSVRPKTDYEKWQIMVGAVLTQNTAWKNVITALLRLESENRLSFQQILAIPTDVLAESIRASGYYNQKAKKLKILAAFFQNSFDLFNSLPLSEARMKLLQIWGIGPETADSILLYAFDYPVFVVDTYTQRIFSRIGLFEAGLKYNAVQSWFEKYLPKKASLYNEYHALIVALGKDYCKPKPLCSNCPINIMCRFYKFRTESAQ